MSDKFRTKTGRLTVYALACGYIEQMETEGCTIYTGLSLTLWHEGGPAYHVRAHDFGAGRIFWETFTKLSDARRFYDKAKKELFS